MESLRGIQRNPARRRGQGTCSGDKCTRALLTFSYAITRIKTGPRKRSLARFLVAAAAGCTRVTAGVERATAGAARDRVGVVHRETATHKAIDEVDLGALDVAGADRVDEEPHAPNFGDGVALFRPVLEAHAVGHPGAAAWLDEHAQAHLGASLLLQEVAQLAERGVRDADQLGVVRDLGVVLVFDHFLSHVRPIIRPDLAALASFEL